MPTVKVILKEKIANLGAEADIVPVKAGYARNFLIPRGKAYEATKGNLRQVATLQAKRAEREAVEIAEAKGTAAKIAKVVIKLELATGQGGKAFGSITSTDIAKALADQAKVTVDRHGIQLDKPIKSSGNFDVPVRLHHDVEAVIRLKVLGGAATPGSESATEEVAE